MIYKNTKTGAIIDSPCIIKGGDWVEDKEEVKGIQEVKVETQPEEVNKVEETKKEPENKEGFDGITIKEIKQELDAFGIKYNPRANKQELYDLMLKGK